MTVLFLSVAAGGARAVADTKVTPPHVFQAVQALSIKVEALRRYMGRAVVAPIGFVVSGAAPREVYFLALNLREKTAQLAFEIARRTADHLPPPPSTPLPSDVLQHVQEAARNISAVEEVFGISTAVASVPLDAGRKPSDVFLEIMKLNRQVNALLDQPVQPSNVYGKLTVAIRYAAEIILAQGGEQAIPDAPAFESDKTPADVYQRLIGIYRLLRDYIAATGMTAAEIHVPDVEIDRAKPSDVSDLASILLSSLDHLHRKIVARPFSGRFYDPGRKVPSHVFQRAGVLEAQIRMILVKAPPAGAS